MNFADFGVGGADELEQDEWSLHGGVDGGRPTFETPKGGELTVVGWKGKKGTQKQYIVTCSLCSEDKELFGEGLFSSRKGSLRIGRSPCGCSYTKWSEYQHTILIKRASERAGYTFLGWAGIFRGAETRLRLLCKKHGEWTSTTVWRLKRGDGCPSCGGQNRKSDDEHIEKCMSSGAFLKGVEFWKSNEKDRRGNFLWYYKCPICSNDEYVLAGLCSGVFKSTIGNLRSGSVSCRCSSAFQWTQEQREFQIIREMEKRNHHNSPVLKFLGWESLSGYKNAKSIFKYQCPIHGEQRMSVNAFLNGKSGCPACAGQGQKQAYIHLITDKKVPVAIKFGIANNTERRLLAQNRGNLFQCQNIGVWEFSSVHKCKVAEKDCKRTLKTGTLSPREMKDGWTETVSVLDLEKVIAIYEKHGGVRIK